jgi:hypothetical protein
LLLHVLSMREDASSNHGAEGGKPRRFTAFCL